MGPLRTRDQIILSDICFSLLGNTNKHPLLLGCHWEDDSAKTSTLQPLHGDGGPSGNLCLWHPCSYLLVSLASTSTGLLSLVGGLSASSTSSAFLSQMTSLQQWAHGFLPTSLSGGLADTLFTLYPGCPSGFLVEAILRGSCWGGGKYLRLLWGFVCRVSPPCGHSLQRWNASQEG